MRHEILDPDRPGRRSNIKRLTYHPGRRNNTSKSEKAGGRGPWRDTRDWSAIKDHLRRTIQRAPEVVINVRGSRKKGDTDGKAIEGVLRYMMYISRGGRLLTVDQNSRRIEGRDDVRDTHGSWNLDMQRTRSGRSDPLHPSFNIIFSMPAKSEPDKVLEAVQAFAKDRFPRHQYVMALHTPETDPADNPPPHPHVHLILRAEDEDGQRIYIRKSDLRLWREAFADQLRMRGIEANASSRAERGVSFKKNHGAEWHIRKRFEEKQRKGEQAEAPIATAKRFLQAGQELDEGRTDPKPWELAMAARRRDVLRQLASNAARLRQEGDVELADQVEQFIRDMPALDTECRRIQRALVEQVQKRLQDRDQGKQRDMPA
jgi:hypothetical protein